MAVGKLRLYAKRNIRPQREQGRRRIGDTLLELLKKKPGLLPGDDLPVRKCTETWAHTGKNYSSRWTCISRVGLLDPQSFPPKMTPKTTSRCTTPSPPIKKPSCNPSILKWSNSCPCCRIQISYICKYFNSYCFSSLSTCVGSVNDVASKGSSTSKTRKSAETSDDYVWDVFYRRPYSLVEWQAVTANTV